MIALAAGMFLAAALGACDAIGIKVPGAAIVPPAAGAQTPEPAPAQATGSAQAGAQTGATAGATAALPPVVDDDPSRLMGLDPRGVAKVLGDPELIRREQPAEIWQYRGAGCVFDVFFYEDAGLKRVTYLEARDSEAQRIEERGCFNELLRARLAKPLG